MEWISVKESLPNLEDAGVLVYFSKYDSIETVNILDYFKPITSGLDEQGNQKYTFWYLSQEVTHWMPLPKAPLED